MNVQVRGLSFERTQTPPKSGWVSWEQEVRRDVENWRESEPNWLVEFAETRRQPVIEYRRAPIIAEKHARIDQIYQELDALLGRRESGDWNDELSNLAETLFTELRMQQRRGAAQMKRRLEAVLHLPVNAAELMDRADELLDEIAATSD